MGGGLRLRWERSPRLWRAKPPFPAGGGGLGVAPYEEGGAPPILLLIFAQTGYPGTWGKEFLHGFSDIGTAVKVHMVPGNHGRNS